MPFSMPSCVQLAGLEKMSSRKHCHCSAALIASCAPLFDIHGDTDRPSPSKSSIRTQQLLIGAKSPQTLVSVRQISAQAASKGKEVAPPPITHDVLRDARMRDTVQPSAGTLASPVMIRENEGVGR